MSHHIRNWVSHWRPMMAPEKKITKPDQTREKWIERKEWVLCVRLMTLLVMCTIQKHKNGGTHTHK